MREQIVEALAAAARQAYPQLTVAQPALTRPGEEAHGDFSSNIALILARQAGEAPLQVAENIAANLPEIQDVAKAEAVAPGFINFYISPSYFTARLGEEVSVPKVESKKILFEFGQPNTHKIPHIGHLFSYCYGESCVRLLKAVGNTVYGANYQGDVGLHVAKCLWAYQKNAKEDPETLAEKIAYLQECYQQGSAAYEEDENAKQAIDELNRAIYLRDSGIVPDWEKTRDWSLEYYRQFEDRLSVHYDKYYLESETSEPGLELVRKHTGTVFEEDQGAVIFRGEKYGLHTRVFINKYGNPTYEAKDLGLIVRKTEDFDFDLSITETGNDQSEYWRVEKQAIELIFPQLRGKIATLHHGMINLSTGKMASRTGNIITAFSLVEMTKSQVKDYIKENREYTPRETEEIAESVGIGAIKYAFLKSTAGKDISFDLESSISFEGNSGPYLQYTHARCRSVLAKAAVSPEALAMSATPETLHPQELSVLRWLDRFGETVAESAAQYAPHNLCGYLFELAQRYSSFYNEYPILSDDKIATQFRLALTKKTADTLRRGLDLLGIDSPQRI